MKTKVVQIIWIFSLLLSIECSACIATTDKKLKHTDPRVIGLLYDSIRVIDKVFQEHGIKYWASGGTLLGAVRHKGIIPWDEDIDLIIYPGEERKIENPKVKQAFVTQGYRIHKDWYGYVVTPLKKPSYTKTIKSVYTKNTMMWPFVDIFVTTSDIRRPNRVILNKKARSRWPTAYFRTQEIFPIQRTQFGDPSLKINIPKEPGPYLDRMFGTDWKTVAYKEWDHAKQNKVEKIKHKLIITKPAKSIRDELP